MNGWWWWWTMGVCYTAGLLVAPAKKGNKTITPLHFSHTIVGVVVRGGSIAARQLRRRKEEQNRLGYIHLM